MDNSDAPPYRRAVVKLQFNAFVISWNRLSNDLTSGNQWFERFQGADSALNAPQPLGKIGLQCWCWLFVWLSTFVAESVIGFTRLI